MDPSVLEVDGVHELMQGDMSLKSSQTDQSWGREADGSGERFIPIAGKSHVKPDHIRLQLSNFAEQTQRVGHSIEVPAANDGKSWKFGFWRWQLISQNRQT